MQAHSLKSFDDEIASGVVALSSHVHYPAATLWWTNIAMENGHL